MGVKKTTPKNIDDYISGFPEEVQVILQKVRMTILEAAPQVDEAISYQMPTFRLDGNLVHFAGYQKHVGFYPTPSGIEKFKDKLTGYELSKGTIKFPLDKPIPYDLIHEIVQFRVAENLEKAANKNRE